MSHMTESISNSEIKNDDFTKIREIIMKEFQCQIEHLETMVHNVNLKIYEIKKIMDQLRFAILTEYYKDYSQGIVTNAKLITTFENRFHWTIKENVHRRQSEDIDYKRVSLSCPNISKSGNTHKVCLLNKSISSCSTISAIQVLNHTRTLKKSKYYLAVGNTSKYIGKVLKPNCSNIDSYFKWVAYVQCRKNNKRVDNMIKMVRFHLHPSYKPNDILQVNEPPFQIFQNGWGEFPLRIQLFFHNNLRQKPIQLVHFVVLDKTLCGRHTLGAETIFEVWLPHYVLNEHNPETDELQLTKLFTTKTRGSLELSTCDEQKTSETMSFKVNDSDLSPLNKTDRVFNGQQNIANSESSFLLPGRLSTKPSENLTWQNKTYESNQINTVFQKNGKVYIIDPSQMKFRQQKKYQISLLKPKANLKSTKNQKRHGNDVKQTEYNSFNLERHEYKNSWYLAEHDYVHSSLIFSQSRFENEYSLQTKRHESRQTFKELLKILNRLKFRCLSELVKEILQFFPIINAKEKLCKLSFESESSDNFHRLDPIKQRVLEWLRAKYIQRVLKSIQRQKFFPKLYCKSSWTSREIATYSRFIGWTPKIKYIKNTEYVGNKIKFRTISSKSFVHNQFNSIYTHSVFKKNQSGGFIDVCTETGILKKINISKKIMDNTRKEVAASNHQQLFKHLIKFCLRKNDLCVPREICPNHLCPISEVLIIQCLYIFIEKLLTNSLAVQHIKSVENLHNETAISPLSICEVIKRWEQADFLMNVFLGNW